MKRDKLLFLESAIYQTTSMIREYDTYLGCVGKDFARSSGNGNSKSDMESSNKSGRASPQLSIRCTIRRMRCIHCA
jgi:hypothetical protein